MSFAEYSDYDGTGLAHLVRRGEVTPAELLEEAIARAEKHNGTLNAIVYKAYDEARKTATSKLADGPFKGVPFLIKDIGMEVANWPMTNGSALLEGYVSQRDAELTKRYRASGMVLYGKTNTPEFGIPGTTEGRFLGCAHNPWNTNHSTGGSSGGAAAAVAAGVVPLAHANDGGGSIRIPASACGLVGLKPTRGRTSYGPDFGDVIDGLGVDLVVSRSVRDTAAALDAVAGYMPGDPYCALPEPDSYLAGMKRKPRKLR